MTQGLREELISREDLPAGGFFQSQGAHPRFYHLPLLKHCLKGCQLCASMGCCNHSDRSLLDAKRALDRASSGEFDAVVFPNHFFEYPQRKELLELCRERGLGVILQVMASVMNVQLLKELKSLLGQGCAVNIVFSGSRLPDLSMIKELESWRGSVIYTFSVFKKDHVVETLRSLPKMIHSRLFFHFSYHLEPGDGRLACREVHETIKIIHGHFPSLLVRPPLGMEMWDLRVDPELALEPMIDPTFVSETSRRELQVSVVIPSYNNRSYLLNTIAHLLLQGLARENFEIIVVDDGSSDGSMEAVHEQIGREAGQVNFKYLYSPRAKPRKMGDANYRAGISRNLGVKHASGEILCFLDSDMLTPSHFLQDLIVKHQTWDVVQCKRLNLLKDKSSEATRYDQINPDTDIFHTDGGYWEEFHQFKNWQAVPFFWKYVCTYGLSMRLEVFKRVGWLKRNFIFYGFEDTELGYRLAHDGYSFHLNEMVAYHLFHQNTRSEFLNSEHLRQRLLEKTAQIFYLNLLEPDVFEHFRSLMRERIPFATYLRHWAQSCVGRIGFHERQLERAFALGMRLSRGKVEGITEALWRKGWSARSYLERKLKALLPRAKSTLVFPRPAHPPTFSPLVAVQGRFPRRLHLPLMSQCSVDCGLCAVIGCLHPETRDLEEVRLALRAAALARHDAVVFPPNVLQHQDLEAIATAARGFGLRPIFQIHRRDILSAWFDRLGRLKETGAAFELLIDDPLEVEAIHRLESHFPKVVPVLIPVRGQDLELLIRSLPVAWRRELKLYAAHDPCDDSRYLDVDELHRWLESVPQKRVEFHLSPYEEPDRVHPEAPPGTSELHQTEILWRRRELASEIRVSIVVPFHERRDELLTTLGSLAAQKLARHQFEVIVVGDRVSEADCRILLHDVKDLTERQVPDAFFNFTLLKIKDPCAFGDGAENLFRAGAARDAGIVQAVGDILVLLDADMVAPPGFLDEVLEAHEGADVVMYRRMHLSIQNLRQGNYEQAIEDSYWTPVFANGSWDDHQDHWKYASTACLSLRARDYFKSGGFPRGLVRYGCEDTFLAWKLSRNPDLRWSARSFHVYHIGETNVLLDRNWVARALSTRKKLKRLSDSAKFFYLSTLDPAVYEVFFASLGKNVLTRAAIKFVSGDDVLRPLIRVIHFGLLFYHIDDRMNYLAGVTKPVLLKSRDTALRAQSRLLDVIWWSSVWRLYNGLRAHSWRARVVGRRAGTRATSLLWWSTTWKLYHWLRSHLWRVRVIGSFAVAGYGWARGSLRWIQACLTSLLWWSTTWKLYHWLRAHSWRVRVALQRATSRVIVILWWSTTWRLYQWLRHDAWSVLCSSVLRARVAVWIALYRFSVEIYAKATHHAWFFRDPVGWTRMHAPGCYRFLFYPFLKLFYFVHYQLRTRFSRVRQVRTVELIKEDGDAS